ncbi:MAG TPA: hypothetical protein VE172_12040, partial [Stackebrandtia sp.]
PLDPGPPPEPERDPARRRGWAVLATLGAIAAIALVTALIVIDHGAGSSPAAKTDTSGIACEPGDPPQGSARLHATTFYKDKTWKDPRDSASAKRLGSWDHGDCCDVGLASAQKVLNDAGCSYGIEAAYQSDDGHMGIAQLILVFGDSGSALDASDLDFTSFKFHSESGIYDESREVYGYVEPNGRYLVATIGAIDTDDKQVVDTSTEVLDAFHTDHASELPW